MFKLAVFDDSTPLLMALYDRVAVGRRKPLMTVLGRRVERKLRRHFVARDAEGNSRGWPRSHFWSRIRRATAFAGASDTVAKIGISDPAFAMKVHGGVIRPVEAQMLAIPLRPEAKVAGRPRAKLIPGLFLLRTKARGAFLARREERALRLYYKLVKSVTMKADPRALPNRAEILRELRDGTTAFLKSEVRRGFAPPQQGDAS
jgi:hypothetical protein